MALILARDAWTGVQPITVSVTGAKTAVLELKACCMDSFGNKGSFFPLPPIY